MRLRGARDEQGFSLVEVLVVVVIISLLAAIAIPIFLAQREKAWYAQSTSTLKNAATTMEAAAVKNEGSYEGITPNDLREEEGLKYSRSVMLLTVESAAGSTGFCISVLHQRSLETIYWDSNEGQPSDSDCTGNYD